MQIIILIDNSKIVTATIDIKEAADHLGDCDVNMESELPEIRLYKAETGICLESPDKHFSVLLE